MKKLAAEFTGHSVDKDGKKWDLRLLPTPLYRYQPAKAELVPKAPGEAPKQTGVIDGALFALVSNAGTDPEVLLVVEAREEKGKVRWEYACGRFSDWELRVQRKDKEVFASVPDGGNTFTGTPQVYRIYPEKVVSLEGKVLTRIRQTATGRDLLPAEDK